MSRKVLQQQEKAEDSGGCDDESQRNKQVVYDQDWPAIARHRQSTANHSALPPVQAAEVVEGEQESEYNTRRWA